MPSRKRIEEKAIYKYVSLRDTAKARGLDFNLTFTCLKNIYRSKKCFYTGEPFGSFDDITLDRVDNTKGYVIGNVVACHKKVNHLKGSLTVQQIEALFKGLKRKGLV